MTWFVSKTFGEVTAESAEAGDFSNTGFVFEDKKMSLSEIIKEIQENNYTSLSFYPPPENRYKRHNENHLWVSGYEDNYDVGKSIINTEYNLHIKCQERHFWKIMKLAGVIK